MTDAALPTRAAEPSRQDPAGLDEQARTLDAELNWLDALLQARLRQCFQVGDGALAAQDLPPPDLQGQASGYAHTVQALNLGAPERLLLILALAPHLRPALLDPLGLLNQTTGRRFSEFGGWQGQFHAGFLPTWETAAFLFAGDNLAQRLSLQACFEEAHPLRRQGLLERGEAPVGEPRWSAPLVVGAGHLGVLTTGTPQSPGFSAGGLVRPWCTTRSWDDLVLDLETLESVKRLATWLRQGAALRRDWRVGAGLPPGHRALFVGPSGTGKALTAALLGQAAGNTVYRIDVPLLLCADPAEARQSMSRLFEQASQRAWLLFFDQADALLAQGGAPGTLQGLPAQAVTWLWRCLKAFPGLAVLSVRHAVRASHHVPRQWDSFVHFPMPDAPQRLRLWQGLAHSTGRFAPGIDLQALAERHEISGGAMVAVLRDAALRAVQGGREQIEADDLNRSLDAAGSQGRAGSPD